MRKTLAAAILGIAAAPATAQDTDALAEFSTLRPDLAVELAQAALASCREAGYQVAVAVVDRFGVPQVVIRDRFAGPHTIETATAKAWTAVSFRTSTLELDRRIGDGTLSPGLRDVPGALALGGGVPVQAAGSIVGGVGVSGAPGPDLDEGCATAAIATISDRLEF